MKLSLILVFVAVLEQCSCARIMFVIPMPARSHYNLGERLMEKLIEKGHEITILAPFKRSKPLKNLTEVFIPDLKTDVFPDLQKSEEGKFSMRNIDPLAFLQFGYVGKLITEKTLADPQVQKIINSNEKYDLILGECFLTEGLLAGLSYHFKAPIIGLATFLPNTWPNEMVGNPYPSSYVPDPILGYTDKMNFQERLINFLYTTIAQINHYMRHLPDQDKVMRDFFGKDMPYITEILAKTSLMLVNHHYSLAFPRPYLPNMIEIGGYHVKPPKPLPQDLENFINGAKHGVIYFSMGSNLLSTEFPKEKFNEILRAFSKLKQRVLWKFEDSNLPNLPENVKISSWLPQSDILAHPNVKLFITHGGLLSFTESVLRGVPVVGIPVFGDQPLNVKYIVNLGLGVKVSYEELENKDVLYNAIQEVLNNPKYRNNIKYRSELLQDLPMPTIDTAIYWIEYVMRYKGAPHLISGAQELRWEQLYMLDVYAFVGGVFYVVFYIFSKLFCCITRTLCGRKNKVSSSKKKN